MKVLHIYRTYFPDPPGGLQEAIRQITLATQKCGVESKVFTLSPNPTPAEIVRPEGMVVRAKSWGAPASCDIGGLDAWRKFRVLAAWADVIHFHFPWPFGDLLNLLGNIRKPSVMTYHSDVVRQRYLGRIYAPLMRHTLNAMTAVVATSPAYVRFSPVLRNLVPKDRLYVIPLGIADYASNPNKLAKKPAILETLGLRESIYFLALGVLRYYKGLHTLIEAASHIPATLVIAGSGPEMDRLRALADRIGARNVIFTGQVSDEEKRILLENCRAMILPSHMRSEAFGMVLVEAAMFGKPMVCCEIGSGTSYVNKNGVTGFVVAPEQPKELSEAINVLLNDVSLAEKMGVASRQRYERLFSGPALGSAYFRLYKSLMD